MYIRSCKGKNLLDWPSLRINKLGTLYRISIWYCEVKIRVLYCFFYVDSGGVESIFIFSTRFYIRRWKLYIYIFCQSYIGSIRHNRYLPIRYSQKLYVWINKYRNGSIRRYTSSFCELTRAVYKLPSPAKYIIQRWIYC